MTLSRNATAATPVDAVRADLKLAAPTSQTLRYLRAVLGLGAHDVCETRPVPTQAKKPAKRKGQLSIDLP